MTIKHETINGLEASRRAGWARYYAEQERSDELRDIINELAYIILLHDRIPSGDKAINRAKELLKNSVD